MLTERTGNYAKTSDENRTEKSDQRKLVELRKRHRYSQRILAYKLQLAGYDMDKNVITRIETNKRYVTDIELKALCEVFDVSYEELIDGKRSSEKN